MKAGDRRLQPVGLVWLILALAAVAVVILGIWGCEQDQAEQRPTRICSIAPEDGEAAIAAAIESCPDGSTVRFPLNAEYHQENRILVKDRHDLVIDGNGSRFVTSADKSNSAHAQNGNWLILRGRNITLRDMTSVGAFAVPGPRNLARASADPGAAETNPSYGLYGVDTIHLIDVRAERAWGDGVTMAPDEYVDGSTPDYTRNVFIRRMVVETVFRHCWAPTSGSNIWIEDSTCRNAWYAGVDAELDNVSQPLEGQHYLRNTFDGYTHGGIIVPVAGEKTTDIEIRGNRFLSGPDTPCFPTILIGLYPESNPRRFVGVVVEDNEIRTPAVAVAVDHIDGGSIRGNTISLIDAGGGAAEPLAACGHDDRIRVTNSTGVQVEGNAMR